ncbi:MAG TPA: CHAD domain-containing protein [Nitrososphaeraceae archaeon]|nr:CHAD domain-containing protein [Nitrososphaeraceae archaeon]
MTKLSENLQRVNNRINKYLKKPDAKQIHDVRTSIRRLDATFLTLPKKYRNASSLSKYVLQCKELFKINSEIRDFDIIYEKLQKYPSNPQRDSIIETTKATRNERLERAKTIALALKSTDIATILDEIGVTEKELQKRYHKILSRLISDIESTFPFVLTNPLALQELHDLRIACKKLRYMLELLPDENKLATKTRESLQKLQDMLGSIHDCDFTIDYLRSLPQSSKEIQEIINMENDDRRLKFEQFLNYCKRRLRISPDSFLIKLRSFNLPK